MGFTDQQLSLQDYLEWENQQPERHEFYRGEVFAITDVFAEITVE